MRARSRPGVQGDGVGGRAADAHGDQGMNVRNTFISLDRTLLTLPAARTRL